MKYLVSLIVTLGFVTATFAQKKFEGKVVYKIEYDNLPAEMEQHKAMLPSETTSWLKGNLTRADQGSAMSSTISIFDSEKKEMMLLMEIMGQKMMVKMDKASIEAEEAKQKDPDIKYSKETKEVAGYDCKKAEITQPDSEEAVTVWYTEDIPNSNKDFKGLKGFPLEYEITQPMMTMRMVAKEVSKEKLKDDVFAPSTEGYTEMTEEQFKQMGAGGVH